MAKKGKKPTVIIGSPTYLPRQGGSSTYFSNLMKKLNKKGQGLSEYLIIMALVVITSVGAVVFFADNVKEKLQNLAEEISGSEATTTLDDRAQSLAQSEYDLSNFTAADLTP